MRDRRLIRFTKLVLDVMFYTGFVIILTLPVSLKFLGKYYSVVISEYFMFMFAVFAASGIFGILIIRQLRRMMRTVIEESCFVYENVKSLEVMGITSAVIVLLFFIKCFFLPTPATFIVVLTFFIAGLFSKVLSFVFREAVRCKEENDLTI